MFGAQLNGQFGSQGTIVLLGDLASIAGAGTTQSGATAITTVNTLVTSGSNGSGVRLPVTPAVAACDRLHVGNQTAVNILVYPPTGGKICNSTANAPVMMPPNYAVDFFCIDGTNYTVVL